MKIKHLFTVLCLLALATPVFGQDDAAIDKMKSSNDNSPQEDTEYLTEIKPNLHRWFVFGGFSGMPGKATGLNNVDITDISAYPNKEGRISFPLGAANSDAFVNLGAMVGLEYAFTPLISILIDLRLGIAPNGKMTFASGLVGGRIKYQIVANLLEIGVSPKIGVVFGSIDFGNVDQKQKPGGGYYQQPVIIGDARIFNQDRAKAFSIGFALQGTADLRFFIGNSGLFAFAEVGWMQAFLPSGPGGIEFEFTKGQQDGEYTRAKIKGDSDYIVNDDDTTGKNHARDGNLKDAGISMNGFIFSIGLGFSF